MNTLIKVSVSILKALTALFLLARRPLCELLGLALGGADVAIGGPVDNVPRSVRAGSLDHDRHRRQTCVTEHEVVLSLSRREFDTLLHQVAELQADVDSLLAVQERGARQLAIGRDGLANLTRSVADGRRAFGEMRDALTALAQEVDLLRTRREQSELEAGTLSIVSGVGAATALERDYERLDELQALQDAGGGGVPGVAEAVAQASNSGASGGPSGGGDR